MDFEAIWLSLKLAFFTTLILLLVGLPLPYHTTLGEENLMPFYEKGDVRIHYGCQNYCGPEFAV